MDVNPYQAPQTESRAVGVISGSRDDLRRIARYQKGILVCILIYLIALVVQLVVPDLQVLLSIAVLVAAIVGTVFVFLLAVRVYGMGIGILLGILTLVPCIGLIVLLVVNGKATAVLRQNGVRVGFLGANLAEV